MNTKTLSVAAIVAAIIIIGSVVYRTQIDKPQPQPPAPTTSPQSDIHETGRLVRPNPDAEIPESELKPVSFSGKLEEVHPGCFVDGECYAVVDGKHVTAILGWTGGKVGAVLGGGENGFGDLEKYIGKEVQVYAHEKGDGTYTLYGSEGFYIKVK